MLSISSAVSSSKGVQCIVHFGVPCANSLVLQAKISTSTAAAPASIAATTFLASDAAAFELSVAPTSDSSSYLELVESDSAPSAIVAAKALTGLISGCRNLAALAALCSAQQQCLNPIHICAALTVCAQHLQQQQLPFIGNRLRQTPTAHGTQLGMFVDWLLQLLSSQLDKCTGRELSTAIWCVSRLQRHVGPRPMQQLLSQYLDVAHSSSCQSTAKVLYATAKLHIQPDATTLDCLLKAVVKSQYAAVAPCRHLSKDSVGVSALQSRCSSSSSSFNSVMLLAPLQQQQQLQQRQLSAQAQQLPVAVQSTSGPQESGLVWMRAVTHSVWALARLQQPAIAQVWLLPLLSLLRSAGDSSLNCSGTIGSSSGSSDTYGSGGCSQQLAARSHQAAQPAADLASASAYACAVGIWACAKVVASGSSPPQQQASQLGSSPGPAAGAHDQQPWRQQQQRWQHFQRAVVVHACALLRQHEAHLCGLQPQSACMLLSSVNRLGITPDPSWCQLFYAALQHIAPQLSTSQCAALLCGMAYLPVRPPAALCAACLSGLNLQLTAISADQLSLVLRACGRLRMRPPAHWVAALLDAFMAPHQQHTPAAVSSLLHAASRLGYKPEAQVVAALLRTVQRDLQDYRPHVLSKLLSGCAALRVAVPPHLQESLLQSFMLQLQAASPSDVVLVLRALASWKQQQQQHHSSASAASSSSGGIWRPVWQQAQATSKPAHNHLQQGSQQQQQGLWSELQRQQQQGRSAPLYTVGSTAAEVAWPVGSVARHAALWQPREGSPGSGVLSEGVVSRLFERAGALVHSMRAAELCQCIWSAAWLQPMIVGVCWSHAINSSLPLRVHELSAGDVCLLLWSLARLRQWVRVQPRLLKQLLLRGQELMLAGCFTARDLSSFAWGLAQVGGMQNRALPAAWQAAFRGVLAQQLRDLSTQQLGVTLRACVLLSIPLGQQLLDTVTQLVEVRSALLNVCELGSLAQSLDSLQHLQRAVRQRPSAQAWAGGQPCSQDPAAALANIVGCVPLLSHARPGSGTGKEVRLQAGVRDRVSSLAPACAGVA